VFVGTIASSCEVLAELQKKVKGENWLATQFVVDFSEEMLQICFFIEEELVKVK